MKLSEEVISTVLVWGEMRSSLSSEELPSILMKDAERLGARVAKLEAALEWYAEEDNWRGELEWVDECCSNVLPPAAEYDEGARAREALKEIE